MKIAVLADTHDRLPDNLIHAFENVDEIWHLGDVVSPSILNELHAAGKPLFVVRGNCDQCTDWPITLDLVRESIRFHLTHIPPCDPPSRVDVVLHGHLHIPRDEVVQGVRFLNPGSISQPRDGFQKTWALLEIENKKVDWQLTKI